jgi:hypothetical protein
MGRPLARSATHSSWIDQSRCSWLEELCFVANKSRESPTPLVRLRDIRVKYKQPVYNVPTSCQIVDEGVPGILRRRINA